MSATAPKSPGGPRGGCAGSYHVRCFLEDGAFSDEYDVVIERHGDVDTAPWRADDELEVVGVGTDTGEGLALGWRRAG